MRHEFPLTVSYQMTTLMIEIPPFRSATTIDRATRWQRDADIAAAFQRRVAEHGQCAYYCKEVTCDCAQGVVRLRGRVPTSRLKQLLASLARELGRAALIDDQVDVINSAGLSCICSKCPDADHEAPVR